MTLAFIPVLMFGVYICHLRTRKVDYGAIVFIIMIAMSNLIRLANIDFSVLTQIGLVTIGAIVFLLSRKRLGFNLFSIKAHGAKESVALSLCALATLALLLIQ